jgi:multidrug efflux pump
MATFLWPPSARPNLLQIQRQPGANVIEVVDKVKALMPQLQATLPASIEMKILTDRTATIRASVKDVQMELLLSVFLVVMVIFFFLRSARATAIPSVAVPVSLVGTFGFMYLAGFSINNLTLMALTVASSAVTTLLFRHIFARRRPTLCGRRATRAAHAGRR